MSEQPLVTVTVDGKSVQVPKGSLLIEACYKVGEDVPYFCYHPKLEPAGVCRMCLVQVEKLPKPVTACTTQVADGMVVHTQSETVQELQKGVLEFLLVNHPLDCPVCDKGGECDLQDLTFKFGPSASRLADAKVRKDKALDLGPFVVLDRERCILCRRCTRFDNEIACEGNLIVAERGHESVVTTLDGMSFDSYFGGNTIELCPVGALTSDLYRFQARPWDLAHVPAVCTACSVGCNTHLDFRHGRLLRVVTRDNPAVDGGWLCDRGRFNYLYAQEDGRLRQPLIRKNGQLQPSSWTEALGLVAERLGAIKAGQGGGAIGVVGGGRLSLEEAYLLQKLGRTVLGTPNLDHRVAGQVTASVAGFPGRISDVDDAKAILIFEVLPAERAPVLDLRIRRALERRGAKVLVVGAALAGYRHRRGIGRVQVSPGGVAAVLAAAAAEVARRTTGKTAPGRAGAKGDETLSAAATQIADLLLASPKTVVIWGGEEAGAGRALVNLLQAAANPKEGRSAHVLVPGEQPGSRGAAWAGMLPGYLPGFQSIALDSVRQAVERAWQAKLPAGAGLDTTAMLQAAAAGQLQALYLVGANLLNTFPDGRLARTALAGIPFLVVQDLFLTDTAAQADVVLPVAPFPARTGSYATLDGLVQQVAQVAMADELQSDGAVFAALAAALGVSLKASDREVRHELAALTGGIGEGQVLPAAPAELLGRSDGDSAARAFAGAGELILVPVDRLYAGGGTARFDAHIQPMRPEPVARLHPTDMVRLGVKSGEPLRLREGEATLDLPCRSDRQVLAGTVQVIRGLPESPVNILQTAGAVTRVGVTRLTPAEVR